MADNFDNPQSDTNATTEKLQDESNDSLPATSKPDTTDNNSPVLNESPAASIPSSPPPTSPTSPTTPPATATATATATVPTTTTTTTIQDESTESYNHRVLTLSDATINELPLHLNKLLSNIPGALNMKAGNLLCVLIYGFAIEVGFVAKAHLAELKNKINILQPWSFFNTKNLLTISSLQPPVDFNNFFDQLEIDLFINVDQNLKFNDLNLSSVLFCKLKFLLTGDYLIITLHTSNFGRSLCLPVHDYVITNLTKVNKISERFNCLGSLAIQINDEIFVPLRNNQLEEFNCYIYPALNGLPIELYEEIFKYLNKNQLNIVANVNKYLYECYQQSRYTA